MNRSLTGPDNLATLDYIKNRYCPSLIVKYPLALKFSIGPSLPNGQ